MLSACLIVKNEEKVLPRCLKSLRGAVDEIVVVDTGSTDRTVEIAREYGAKIGSFEWCDDFAAARNASLDLATSDWIIQMDADEELWHEDIPKLRRLVNGTNTTQTDSAYVLLRNLKDLPLECQEGISLPNPEQWPQSLNHFQRLFRRLPHLRYSGVIHEAIANVQHCIISEVSIYHYGYAAGKEINNRRLDRNRKLTLKHIQLEPKNPAAYFYAGGTCFQGGQMEEAEKHLLNAVRLSDPNDKLRRHFMLNALMRLAQIASKQGNFTAMKDYSEQTLEIEPEYLDPWLRLGEALFKLGHYWPAERALRRYLEIREELRREVKHLPYTIYLLDEEHQAHFLLGRIAQERDDFTDAKTNYQRSHELNPNGVNNPAEALSNLYEQMEVG